MREHLAQDEGADGRNSQDRVQGRRDRDVHSGGRLLRAPPHGPPPRLLVDFRVLNTFQFASEHARFRTFFVATILRPDGERRTLQYLDGMEDPQHEGRHAAKLCTTTAVVEGKREDEKDVEWVEMRVGPVREVLEREFGMRFPSDYSGN